MKHDWVIYLLKCADGTYYCGCTNNLDKRVKAHNNGKGAKYTKGRGPVEIIGTKTGYTRGDALRDEIKIKKLPKNKKLFAFQRRST